MFKKRSLLISLLLVVGLLFAVAPRQAQAQTGTPDTTWYVGHETETSFTLMDADDLAGLAQLVDGGVYFSGKTILLGADIDLSLYTNWNSIGGSWGTPAFQGVFEGNDKTISNLTSNRPGEDFVGLFGTVSGTIQNFTLTEVEITGRDAIGGVVGYLDEGTVNDVTITYATINAKHWAGGIAGFVEGTLNNVHANNVTVTLTYNTDISDDGDKGGGLVGYMTPGILSNCSVTDVTVSGTRDVGGLVGSAGSASVTNCTSSGATVTSTNIDGNTLTPYTGGAVGRASGALTITNVNVTDATLTSTPEGFTGLVVGGGVGPVTINNIKLVHGTTETFYSTIKAAYDAAVNGDTIYIAAGEYIETPDRFQISKNLTIVGADKATTIIKPDNNSTGQYYWWEFKAGYTINISGVTLDGTGLYTGIIYAEGSGVKTINDNIIKNTKINGYAILGIGGSNTVISNNIITSGGYDGVYMSGTSTITGNTITGRGTGNVMEFGITVAGGGNATITGNTITNFRAVDDGVVSGIADPDKSAAIVVTTKFYDPPSTATANITGNILTDSTVGLLVGGTEDADRSTVTATGNTFARNDFQVEKNAVSTTTNFNVDAAFTGNTFDQSAMVQGGTIIYPSIQKAIDVASDGDTVLVGPGTYTEQVTIPIAVTLIGVDEPTIQAFDSMPVCFTTSKDHRPVVCVLNTTATIDGFTIDGKGLGSTNVNFEGVAFRNAGGTLQNSTIKDIRNEPFSGAQHGVAIYVYNDDLTARTVHVLDNEITGFQKNAMALNASDTNPLTVDVQRNVITGVGLTTVTAQNGIQVWATAGGGLVKDNEISGINYINDVCEGGYVATSILNYYADVDITDNVITGAQEGIYQVQGTGDILRNEITLFRADVCWSTAVDVYKPTADVLVQDNIINYQNPDALTGKDSYGIAFVTGSDVVDLTVDGNTVSGVDMGIDVYQGDTATGDLSSLTITDNTVTSNMIDVWVEGAIGVVPEVHQNSLLGTAIKLQNEVIPVLTVDATLNYWGSVCGPTPESVFGDVLYYPWNINADGTPMDTTAQTHNFLPTTGMTVINETIACAPSYSTFNFGTGEFTGNVIVPSSGQDHQTLVLADDANINATSPCFTVGADFTTIKAENIGMAACVTAAGSNGIDVADGIRNLTVDGLEIYGPGNDGIHFAGVIRDVVLKDNFIHDLVRHGVFFGAQPVVFDPATNPDGIDIHGNLFENNGGNGIEAGTFTVPANYNSWGNEGGPAGTINLIPGKIYAGDGISSGVDADPFTHVDVYMVASGTPWTDIPLNQVVSGQTITFKVMAHVVNTLTVDVKLAYPTNLTGAVTSVLTSAFPSFAVIDTSIPNVIGFYGMGPYGTTDYLPVTGDVELFTVTFTGGTPGLDLPMDLDETSDVFGMEGVGSSSNIYAVELLDSKVNVIDLPIISSTDIQGPYIAGLIQEFHVRLENPDTGGNFSNVLVNFKIEDILLADVVSFEYFDGTNWWNLPLTQDGTDLVGSYGPSLGFPMSAPYDATSLFRIIVATPGEYDVHLEVVDLTTDPDYVLDTFDTTAVVNGNFTVTGTFSMQGRSTRTGIPVTLDYQDLGAYTDKTGTTINQITYNLVIPGVNGGNWLLTTLQPRYLNVIAANNKIVLVDGNEILKALQLLGGNAVWSDNIINVADASQVGTDYGNPLGVSDPSTLDGDCNFDGKINVQDLALVGGNFDKTSETAYGVGSAIWFVQ